MISFPSIIRREVAAACIAALFLAACANVPAPVTAPTSAPTIATAEAFATATPAALVELPTVTPAQEGSADAQPTEEPTGDDAGAQPSTVASYEIQKYPVPNGAHPHDVAPAPSGGIVWYTAQHQEALGILDPETGSTRHIHLGTGSRPHGVIVGPDGAPWITDGGLNAIVRVDPATEEVQVFPLPASSPNANLNTATFDGNGVLWFTGQNGIYGRLDPQVGEVEVFAAPEGRGPYGITTTPNGDVYYCSLAGSHIARINTETGEATVIEPPTPNQGARRVWSDSQGRIWVSEWNSGQVSVYDPATETWDAWKLPGTSPRVYAVYVDEQDMVWVSEWESQSMVRFDPQTEEFEMFPLGAAQANVRQILGRAGEVWAPESGTDQILVLRRNDLAYALFMPHAANVRP
jgi:virginiamycin B lyase